MSSTSSSERVDMPRAFRVSASCGAEERSVAAPVAAGLPDVADLLGVFDDSLLALGFSLFAGHSDFLTFLDPEDDKMIRLDLKLRSLGP
jgi:hypothetical protein